MTLQNFMENLLKLAECTEEYNVAMINFCTYVVFHNGSSNADRFLIAHTELEIRIYVA